MECNECGREMVWGKERGWICENSSCSNYCKDEDAVGEFRDREISIMNQEV